MPPEPMAARGRRARAHPGMAWLGRRWWVLIVTTVGVLGLAAGLGGTEPARYRARLVVVVVSGNNRSPSEAQRLATTYAALIPQDVLLLASVSQRVGIPSDKLASHLVVNWTSGTQLLDIAYTGATAQQARDVANDLLDAITGPNPASPAITPSSLVVVRSAQDTTTIPPSWRTTVPLGALLGLLLGIGLVVMLERVDARVDEPAEAAAELGCPVTPVVDTESRHLEAVVARWRQLAEALPMRIALLPATPGAAVASTTEWMAVRLSDSGALVEPASWKAKRTVPRSDGAASPTDSAAGTSAPQTMPSLTVGGAPGGAEAGELLAADSDVTVLVVLSGAKVRRVRAALAKLAEFDVRPDWCMFVPGVATRVPRQRAPVETEVRQRV